MSTKPKAPAKPKAKAKAAAKPTDAARFAKDSQIGIIRVRTIAEAARTDSMWAGTNTVDDHIMYLIETESLLPRFAKKKISVSTACMKMPDEVLVNCSDQFNRSCQYTTQQGGPVSRIDVTYDLKSGHISITNDGQGFPICPANLLKGYDPATMAGKWSVEILLTAEHAGSNSGEDGLFNGGVNGEGMKIVLANCVKATIETVNAISNMYYYQEFHNGTSRIDKPKIVDLNDPIQAESVPMERRVPHTTITMDLDYANLCQTGTDQVWFNPETSKGFSDYLQTRCYQLAAYFSSLEYRYQRTNPDDVDPTRIEYHSLPRVYFNGDLIRIDSLRDYALMFPIKGGHLIKFNSSDSAVAAPWHVFIGLRDELGPAKEPECMSFINSVYLPEGGSHVNMLVTKVKTALMPYLKAKLKLKEDMKIDQMASLNRLLFIFDSRQAPNKGFEGQVKSKLVIGRAQINQMAKVYEFSEADAKALWKQFGDSLVKLMTAKSEVEQIKEAKPRAISLARIPGFIPAQKIGPKYSHKGGYFICEGETAGSQVTAIMNVSGAKINNTYWSLFKGRGVPMGALKNSVEADFHEFIGQRYKCKAKLRDNVILNNLAAAVGVDYNYHYFYEPVDPADRNPNLEQINPKRYAEIQRLRAEGDRQWATLNTHFIAIAADQDVDGMGQITPSYILYFMVFWPQLLRRVWVDENGKEKRFLNKLQTPIVRAYPKRKSLGAVLQWFDEAAFAKWVKDNYKNDEDLLNADYEVSYYKGLGGHSTQELNNMAKNILNNFVAVCMDEAAKEIAQQMYGASSKERKLILSRQVIPEYDADLLTNHKTINFSEMLLRETTLFQMDFCYRKLPSPIDGLIESQRKVLTGARKAMAKHGKKILVYQMTADVTKSTHYKHGDMAMNKTVIMMAQKFVGANLIPILLPVSNAFGNRRLGRDIVGQPRYISLVYNAKVMELMFPRIDDLLLDYNREEGTIVEPKYYVPVLPMALLTTYTTTSAGWKIDSWARDLYAVVNNVRRMILFNYPENPAGKPISMLGKPWLVEGMRCVVGRSVSGKVMGEICLGEYEYDMAGSTITITQMPIKLWSSIWRDSILGLKEAEKEAKAMKSKKAAAKGKPKASAKAGAKPKAPARKKKASAKAADTSDSDSSGDEANPKEREDPKIRTRMKGLVENAYDNTDDMNTHRTNVQVKLKPGAMDAIEASYKAKCEQLGRNLVTDPVEHYLELRTQMYTNINMMKENGFVQSFANYEEVLEYWYMKRRELYIERLARIRVLMELRVRYYDNLLRYIVEDSQTDKKFNIDKLDDNERYEALEKAKFDKFYATPLFNPVKVSAEGLRKLVTGAKASYDYVDKATSYDKSAKGTAAIRKKRDEAAQLLAEAMKNTWQKLWEQEIDAVLVAIEQGIKQNWEPTADKYEFEDA